MAKLVDYTQLFGVNLHVINFANGYIGVWNSIKKD